MNIEGYEISEKRIVTIRRFDDVLSVDVPMDFVLTKEWINEQFRNPELTKCKNWLKKNGFFLKDGKWCLLSRKDGKSNHIKLPQFFINEKLNTLRVDFGRVIAKTFYLPRPDVRSGYYSIKEFPDYLPVNCSVDMNNSWYNNDRIGWVDFTATDIYATCVKEGKFDSLNASYYYELLKRVQDYEASLTSKVTAPVWPDDKESKLLAERHKKNKSAKEFLEMHTPIFEKDQEYVNIRNSFNVINKFNL